MQWRKEYKARSARIAALEAGKDKETEALDQPIT
jgi:hypothetical protein